MLVKKLFVAECCIGGLGNSGACGQNCGYRHGFSNGIDHVTRSPNRPYCIDAKFLAQVGNMDFHRIAAIPAGPSIQNLLKLRSSLHDAHVSDEMRENNPFAWRKL